MVKLSRNNLRQQNRKSHTRRGGLFWNNPSCPEDEFLHEGKCLKECPEDYHKDTNCHPHECVYGVKSSLYNRARAASCVKGRALKEFTSSKLNDLSEFTKSKAQLAKAKWQKERYEWSKRYVAMYDAAHAGDQQAVDALEALQQNEQSDQQNVLAEAVSSAREEVKSETQDMINTAAAAVKEEVRQEVIAEVHAETKVVVDEAAAAASVAAKAANDAAQQAQSAAQQAQSAADALANIAQPNESVVVKSAGRNSRRRRY